MVYKKLILALCTCKPAELGGHCVLISMVTNLFRAHHILSARCKLTGTHLPFEITSITLFEDIFSKTPVAQPTDATSAQTAPPTT